MEGACWEIAVTEAIAVVDWIYDGQPCTKLSVQGLMNHVHQIHRTREMILNPNSVVPSTGVLHLVYFAFLYAETYEIPSADVYPYVGKVQDVRFNDRPQGEITITSTGKGSETERGNPVAHMLLIFTILCYVCSLL